MGNRQCRVIRSDFALERVSGGSEERGFELLRELSSVGLGCVGSCWSSPSAGGDGSMVESWLMIEVRSSAEFGRVSLSMGRMNLFGLDSGFADECR